MTSQADAFSNQSAAKRSDVEERSAGLSLRIAVLGPNLDDIGNVGTQKRYQIRNALENDGHQPFFPERELDTSDASQLWLELERQLLGDESVDLVIIFHSLRRCAEVVDVDKLDAGLKRLVDPSRHRDFTYVSPAARGKHAQVTAAFQPDASQVSVEVLQGGETLHLEIKPKITAPVIRHAQVSHPDLRTRLPVRCRDDFLSSSAGRKMPQHTSLRELLAAVRAFASWLLSSSHSVSPRIIHPVSTANAQNVDLCSPLYLQGEQHRFMLMRPHSGTVLPRPNGHYYSGGAMRMLRVFSMLM